MAAMKKYWDQVRVKMMEHNPDLKSDHTVYAPITELAWIDVESTAVAAIL